MQYALPPRKSAPFTRSTRTSLYRRKRLKLVAIIACAAIAFICIALRLLRSPRRAESIPAGTPEVVIVSVLDPSLGKDYVTKIKENREDYAARHGYKTFFTTHADYDVGTSPKSWVLLPSVRHAMSLFPHSAYFFALSPHAMIMNPSLSLTGHVMDRGRLESIMLRDKPVVPPDSVIHTFSHLKGNQIDLVITQDGEGLCPESFVLRRGEWSNFFLDVWFDPLYRSYNFQKAEAHALEHIVQWHPTILTKLALVPPRTLNSYTAEIKARGGKAVTYQDGDFVARPVGCEKDSNRNCEKELDPWYQKWKAIYGQKSQ